MDLSGSQFRSVAESKNLSFSTNFSVEGITGVGEFSISGENNKINFDLKSGKIYDDSNNYVYSYLENDNITISGDLSNTRYSYYINNQPFALGKTKSNFKVQKICFESTGLNFSNVSTEVRGTAPDYYIEFPDTFVSSGHHTGFIHNNSSSLGFRLLGVDVINNYTPYWSVTEFDKDILPNDSGKIVVQDLSGSPLYHTGKYDLKFHTNFGPIESGISALSQPSSFRNVDFSVKKITSQISITGITGGYSEGENKENLYAIRYSTFSGNVPSGDRELFISLEYNEGTTGDFFNGPDSRILGTGEYVRTLYEYGYARLVTGKITGQFSGQIEINGSGHVGEYIGRKLVQAEGHTGNYISGFADSTLTTFAYASGTGDNQMMSGTKEISPYGNSNETFIGSGSGILTEYYNGTWNYTPGAYVATTGELTGIFTGRNIAPSDLATKYYEKYITGSDTTTAHSEVSSSWYANLFNDISGDGNIGAGSVRAVDPAYAASGITGVTAHSGLWSGDVIASGLTSFSGSGAYSGFLTGYTKSFTGSFNLYTGTTGLYDFYESGIEYGSYIWGPHGNIGLGPNAGNVGVYTGYKTADNHILEGSGVSSQAVRVRFTPNYDYEPIVATLTISGIDDNVYTDTITGIR